MKGLFITFEGSERCGKSTQSKLLYNYLKRKGCNPVYLREPGGTKISEYIRKILLDHHNHTMVAQAELLLYMASRAQLVGEVINPALKKGKIVICDRFLDSTLAYQGYGLGVDVNFIKQVGNFSTNAIKPDLTILLDLPAEKGLRKCGKVKDRIERRCLEYHLKVRRGYLKLAADEPKRIKIVKVAKDKLVTQKNIRSIVEAKLCRLRM